MRVPTCHPEKKHMAKGLCGACYTKEWNKTRTRKTHRRDNIKRWGITLDDYEALLEKQGGGCAICGKTDNGRLLAIDHDHRCCSGRFGCQRCIRALLCGNCNRGIGLFADDAALLTKAAEYLRTVG